jgi:hypothetical protein
LRFREAGACHLAFLLAKQAGGGRSSADGSLIAMVAANRFRQAK